MEYSQGLSLQEKGSDNRCGSPATVGERRAVEEHLGGGTSPCNKCLQLEPKVISGSHTLNFYTNVPRHTLLFLCAFRNNIVLSASALCFLAARSQGLISSMKKSHCIFGSNQV